MKHYAPPDFWQAYQKLPPEIKRVADRSFKLLRDDPKHPSLQFKKVGPYWSARVTQDYRAVAAKSDEDYVWFWIGTHAEYDRLLRMRR